MTHPRPDPEKPLYDFGGRGDAIGRRSLCVAAAVGVASASRPAAAQVRQIRVVDPGGTSTEALVAAYIRPFTARTGIRVVVDSPNPLGKLRALVETRSSGTALYVLGAMNMEQAKALRLLDRLDWEKIAPDPMFPEARDDHGMGTIFYSTMMAWRRGVRAPETWKDFFNSKDFPGKRTLPDNPVYVLGAVLLASGVPMENLYPLDVDRAFGQLDVFKKDVAIWWKAGAQPSQLLRDNEVQYAIAYSGRVTGQPDIGISFNQASLDVSYICLVKGTPAADADAAYRLIHEISVAANQLTAFGYSPYPGSSPDLERLLPPEALAELPTAAANKRLQFIHDASWWYVHGDAVQKRWQEFILNL